MPSSLAKVSLIVGAVGFVSYCVYFDRKRRNDPNFKEKLKAKRALAKKSGKNQDCEIPIFKDPADMQAFFLKEVQISDELMQIGQFDEAVLHLANAAVVCNQKSEFLGVMQKSLPPSAFQLLIQYYQIANERYIKKLLEDQAMSKMANGSKEFIDDADIE
ncbi:hypothetical protein RDWZM_009589 [Blomia tropicalis]|uniref:Mitochondrial import receptor subunit TOM20 n=1 Tax=Blomia tropicalis TaxID=40697 RepID=A0A9Q0M6L1_BLOTA|nr:Mitochondrial import receptor subunit TOM20 [Blomia tropicalis]KAJ6218432.1 hypothetical protein RDWZM_009589 [Blomia tropicalis]